MPHASVAVQVLVIVEALGQAPAAMASENVIVGAASQLSVTVAVPIAAGVESSSHSLVILAGTVRIGSVVSSLVIV